MQVSVIVAVMVAMGSVLPSEPVPPETSEIQPLTTERDQKEDFRCGRRDCVLLTDSSVGVILATA